MSIHSKKPTILVDLLPATDGFAGIPQESRLLFKVLSKLNEEITVGGFIYSNSLQTLKYQFNHSTSKGEDIITAANYFDDMLATKDETKKFKELNKLKKICARFKLIFLLLIRRKFTLKELDTSHFFGFLWRTLFAKTLKYENFQLLQNQRYFISDLNTASMRLLSLLHSSANLKTEGWNFAIFQFQRSVKLSPGTKKIIRYHDSIAFQDMDVTMSGSSFVHSYDFKNCRDDSFYVCNSEPTREELCKLAPALAERSVTIPPIVANYTKSLDREKLISIIRRNFSNALLSDEKQKIISDQLMNTPNFQYILILSTLEPRKNHINLIRAWESLRANNNSNLKLMIVGSQGWKYDDIFAHMKPHVHDGTILHLEKIIPIDMGFLYSHAEAFVFPSFNEGFGSPPLEAMQCDCPVIASDIKTHRSVYGEAALYCNPYDVESIKSVLNTLLFSPNSNHIREELVKKGHEQVKLYSEENIAQQWLEFFKKISLSN